MDSRVAPDSVNHDVSNSFTRDAFSVDIEAKAVPDAHLMNDSVKTFLWQGVTVTVKDNKTGQPKAILNNVDGFVEAGMPLVTAFCRRS